MRTSETDFLRSPRLWYRVVPISGAKLRLSVTEFRRTRLLAARTSDTDWRLARCCVATISNSLTLARRLFSRSSSFETTFVTEARRPLCLPFDFAATSGTGRSLSRAKSCMSSANSSASSVWPPSSSTLYSRCICTSCCSSTTRPMARVKTCVQTLRGIFSTSARPTAFTVAARVPFTPDNTRSPKKGHCRPSARKSHTPCSPKSNSLTTCAVPSRSTNIPSIGPSPFNAGNGPKPSQRITVPSETTNGSGNLYRTISSRTSSRTCASSGMARSTAVTRSRCLLPIPSLRLCAGVGKPATPGRC